MAGTLFTAANGDELTPAEAQAIAALQRLAKHWPPTLKLVSMGGSLSVIHGADPRWTPVAAGTWSDSLPRQACVLADIDGIPNDGGDW
jgi:hypothetical protein